MFRIFAASLATAAFAAPLSAQPLEPVETSASSEDALLRLPGTGEVKSRREREKLKADKLKAGGGLLASFDADEDGQISEAELEAGIAAAFETADVDGDGTLTAFEQQDWANGLPTRDNSLANPVRFDPNLDRIVSLAEFSAVITNLWADYREEGEAHLSIASLKAPKEERRRNRFGLPEEYRGDLPGEDHAGEDRESEASLDH
jgi:hypothetical protein